ncbi:MAG: choice-of-anchor D domain-containing protein [Chlorobi bacterium]|nr:choice-of-anchor D domain-containing protein [Chlorobiota bacterium]
MYGKLITTLLFLGLVTGGIVASTPLPEQGDKAEKTTLLAFPHVASTATPSAIPNRVIGEVLIDSLYRLQFTSLYFGVLCPGQKISIPFSIRNISGAPFTVTRLEALSPFTVLGITTPFTLLPDQLVTFNVQFAPTSKGAISAPLIIRTSASTDADTLILRGDSRDNSIAIFPPSIDFGNVSVGTTIERTITIQNLGSDSVRIGNINIAPYQPSFSIISDPLPIRLPVGAVTTIRVQFTAPDTGILNTGLKIHIDTPCPADTLLPVFTRGISGIAAISQTSITFPEFWCETEKASDTLFIENVGTDTLTLFPLQLTGPDAGDFSYSVSTPLPRILQPGERVGVFITFATSSPGTKSAVLLVSSTDYKDPVRSIPLAGTLRRATFLALPSNVVFGDVYISGESVVTFTVINSNPVPTRISNIRFDPVDPDFQVISPFPAAINADDSVQVTVRFAPTKVATHYGKILVAFDVPCPDSIEVSFSARGVQGTAFFSPSAIDLGRLLFCETKSDTVFLRNIGTAPLTVTAATLEGINANLFSIVEPVSFPIDVIDGDSLRVIISGAPVTGNNGFRAARLRMTLMNASDNEIFLPVRLRRQAANLSVWGPFFPQTDIRYGSTAEITIYNNGNFPAAINTATLSTPEFSVLASLPLTVQPGDSIRIPIRFTPPVAGRYFDTLRVSGTPCDLLETYPIQGQGFRCQGSLKLALGSGTMVLDTLSGDMGSAVAMDIIAVDDFGPDNISEITFRLRYNPTVLIPLDVAPGADLPGATVTGTILQPGLWFIRIQTSQPFPGGATHLARIRFTAVLGNEVTSTVSVEPDTMQALCNNTFTTQGLLFGLTGYCPWRVGEELVLRFTTSLDQNAPNPFNPETQINFNLENDGHVKLSVLDLLGRTVAVLVDNYEQKGKHSVIFHATDVPSGLYFAVLETDGIRLIRKMILSR